MLYSELSFMNQSELELQADVLGKRFSSNSTLIPR